MHRTSSYALAFLSGGYFFFRGYKAKDRQLAQLIKRRTKLAMLLLGWGVSTTTTQQQQQERARCDDGVIFRTRPSDLFVPADSARRRHYVIHRALSAALEFRFFPAGHIFYLILHVRHSFATAATATLTRENTSSKMTSMDRPTINTNSAPSIWETFFEYTVIRSSWYTSTWKLKWCETREYLWI